MRDKASMRASQGNTVFWKKSLILCGIGFLVYSPTFLNPFIWDDENIIIKNPCLRPIIPIPKIFIRDLLYGTLPGSNYYRPLQTLSYRLDYRFWGTNPAGYHLSNLLLHLLVAQLILIILLKTSLPAPLPFLVSVFFLIHPVHTEAVAYISGRADLLAAAFILTALLFHLKGIETGRRINYCLSCLFFLTALLAKEISVAFPPALLLSPRARIRKGRPPGWAVALPFFIAITYLVARLGPLNFGPVSPLRSPYPLLQRLCTFSKTIPVYLGMMLLPVNLRMERTVAVASHLVRVETVASVGLIASLVILILRARSRAPAVFAGGAWFFLWLLPVSNLVPLNSFLAEHWLYLSSAGFILGALDLLSRGPGMARKSTGFLLFATLICFCALTWKRSGEWGRPAEFFRKNIRLAPHSAMIRLALANLHQEKGALNEAEAELLKAIDLKPDFPEAHNNLGLIYKERGEAGRAIAEIEQALHYQPRYQDALNNLGRVYEEMGEFSKAKEQYLKALTINPLLAEAHNNLGIVFFREKDLAGAEQAFRRALELRPAYPEAAYNLGNLFFRKGKLDESISFYRQALRIKPDYLPARVNLGSALAEKGDYASARNEWEAVLRDDPGSRPARDNLKKLKKLGH